MVYRVAEIRKLQGMTQEELALKSSVSRTIISGLESGTLKTTTTRTLEAIARTLGVSVTDLFFDEVFSMSNTSEKVN